jgi:hypothetical protein
MKTIAKMTLAGAFLLTSAAALANGNANATDKKGIRMIEVQPKVVELLDPVFSRKGDKLYMNLLNLDLKTVTIKVYDSEGRLVYSDKNKGEQIVQKAFNFENAIKDTYKVVIYDGNKKFEETVTVK